MVRCGVCHHEYSIKYSSCPFCDKEISLEYPDWTYDMKKKPPREKHAFLGRLLHVINDHSIQNQIYDDTKYNFESIVVYQLAAVVFYLASIIATKNFRGYSNFIFPSTFPLGYILFIIFISIEIVMPTSIIFLWLIKFLLGFRKSIFAITRLYSYVFFDDSVVILVLTCISFFIKINVSEDFLIFNFFLLPLVQNTFVAPIAFKTTFNSTYLKTLIVFLLATSITISFLFYV